MIMFLHDYDNGLRTLINFENVIDAWEYNGNGEHYTEIEFVNGDSLKVVETLNEIENELLGAEYEQD